MNNRDFKGVWIPKEIWLCEGLSAVDKVLFAEISSLDNENHCTATNEYFAKFCDISEATVKRSIKKLIDLGYIENVGFDGRQRTLKVVSQQGAQIEPPDSSKCTPINIINNIDNNITDNVEEDILLSNDNNNGMPSEYEQHSYSNEDFIGSVKKEKKSKKKNLYQKCIDEINNFTDLDYIREPLIEYLNFRLSVKDKPLHSIAQWKSMLKKLDNVVGETNKPYEEIIQQSIDKAWLNFYPISKGKKDVFSEFNSVNCEKEEEDIVEEF